MQKYIILTILLSLVLASGCEDFLEEEPQNDPTQSGFFGPNASESAVEQLINGIYQTAVWAVWDRRYFWFTTVPADGFNHTTAFDAEGQEYDLHNFNAGQFNIFRMWNYVHWPIGRANSYLANHEQLVELHGDRWTKLNRFRGEALFLRAFWWFFGVQAFGEIPLVVDQFPDGQNFPNSSYQEIYNQIIRDLREIIDNNYLPNWREFDGTSDEGRVTIGAAKTLLAKVYLTRATSPVAQANDFQEAATLCRNIMDTEGYALFTEPDLDANGEVLFTAYEKAFLPDYENGPEGIYEYQFHNGNSASPSKLNSEWVPAGFFNKGDGGKLRFEVTELLYNTFEAGDTRLESFHTGEYFNNNSGEISSVDKIWMSKFQDPAGTTSNNFNNNFPFLRFADVLLMHAEALNEANNGPTADAYESINRVRRRANLPDLSGLNFDQFRDAVRNERFKELAGEGWRLWDLRRWGFDYLKQRVESSNSNASVQQHEMLWPVPDYELGVNPMISQNPGY